MFKPQPAKIVFYVSSFHSVKLGLVIATDSEWVTDEVEMISPSIEDLGIDDDIEDLEGFYLWEGVLQLVTYRTAEGDSYPETEYEGTYRPITDDKELIELLKMRPND